MLLCLCPAAPQQHPCSARAGSGQRKGGAGSSPLIAHPARRQPAAAPSPPSRTATGKRRRLSSHGDTHQGGRYKGQPSRFCKQHRATDLPGDGLGLLPVPPDSYSCSCHADGKTFVRAHVRAS